ncbi:MAG: FHA domain-containing protein [Bradymonadaceae bacterium]
MQCPLCDSNMPSDARFCAYCGVPVMRCVPCDRAYTKDAQFCGTCGGGLVTGTPAAPATPEEPEKELPKVIIDDGLIINNLDDPDLYGYIYELTPTPRQYPIRVGENTLGAGRNNDIVVNRSAISWNHALFICRNERVLLQDSASTNGTFVNGKRVRSPLPLAHGDTVRFGDQDFEVWLRIDYRD